MATLTPAQSKTSNPASQDFAISHRALDIRRPADEPASTGSFFANLIRRAVFIHSPEVSEYKSLRYKVKAHGNDDRRSPDGVQRNPGTIVKPSRPIPDFASLHPGCDLRASFEGRFAAASG